MEHGAIHVTHESGFTKQDTSSGNQATQTWPCFSCTCRESIALALFCDVRLVTAACQWRQTTMKRVRMWQQQGHWAVWLWLQLQKLELNLHDSAGSRRLYHFDCELVYQVLFTADALPDGGDFYCTAGCFKGKWIGRTNVAGGTLTERPICAVPCAEYDNATEEAGSPITLACPE